MSEIDIERFARHIVLKEIGGPGQQKLKRARIFITGAGGLGSPAALYLAAAGVGHLTIADPDTVSLDNLQRQILYRTDEVGEPKVLRGKAALTALNPGTAIDARQVALTPANARELIAGHDLVLDGTDDFATRFAVNDACLAERIPLVSGAVGRWDGQVGVFGATPESPCYRCLVPDIPPDAETCARVGIVGALPGMIGSMMALEAIKHITGAGDTLDGRIFLFDGLTAEARTLKLPRDPACPACGG